MRRLPSTGVQWQISSAFVSADECSKVTIDKYSYKLYAKIFVIPIILERMEKMILRALCRYSLIKAEATGFNGSAGTAVHLINQVSTIDLMAVKTYDLNYDYTYRSLAAHIRITTIDTNRLSGTISIFMPVLTYNIYKNV
ncbi:MAG TPA: hypothetical protein VL053_09605 [Arachidicoccus sp.]|nr:hypothetical protein [Arachidicoccus sp.]